MQERMKRINLLIFICLVEFAISQHLISFMMLDEKLGYRYCYSVLPTVCASKRYTL